MRIIFCDDDPMVIEQLLSYVSEFFAQLGGKKVEFAYYSSGDALLNAKVRADIAFLDVEMPGVSGIHVGAKLKELNPNITNEGVFVRRAEEIICVEATQRKVLVHTIDGALQSTQNMEYWRQTLALPCFYMTHRSYIVNLHFVNSIRKDTILLKYRGREMIAYLTKRRYVAFKDTYLWYMESVK